MSKLNIKSSHFYQTIHNDFVVSEEQRGKILREFPVPVFSIMDGVLDIQTYNHGDFVHDSLVLLNSYEKKPTANGGAYLQIQFSNKNGSFGAKIWDRNGSLERYEPLLEKHALFLVKGKVDQFPRETGPKNLVIDNLTVYEGEVDAFELLPSTQHNMEDLTVELVFHLKQLESPYREIAFATLKKFWKEFSMKPAAKGHHHAYLGGLLKHTLGLIRITDYIEKQAGNPYDAMLELIRVVEQQAELEMKQALASELPVDTRKLVWYGSTDHVKSIFFGLTKFKDQPINFSLIKLAELLHDIGKAQEYFHVGDNSVEKFQWLFPNADFSTFMDGRKDSGITMDPLGSLMGHMAFGVLALSKIIEENEISVKIEDIVNIDHCILAHHGKLEWGSNVWMMTPEAHIIHFSDYLDSRFEQHDTVK